MRQKTKPMWDIGSAFGAIKKPLIAKETGVNYQEVKDYFNPKRYHKTGRPSRRKIRRWLIENKFISVKIRPRHECRDCGKEHAIKNSQSTITNPKS